MRNIAAKPAKNSQQISSQGNREGCPNTITEYSVNS
jgi:hypothetical protein